MVNSSQEMAKRILNFLDRKRTERGYLKADQKRHHFYGSSSKTALIRKRIIRALFSLSFVPQKKISYLSRTEKRKRYGGKILRAVLVIFTATAILGVVHKPVIHYVETLTLFQIKKIAIHGCHETRRTDIKDIAGIDYKTSMVTISAKDLRKRLLEHDWISDAHIEKVWPNHLIITVYEHTPAALLVKTSGPESGIFYVNSSGEVIAPIEPGDDLDFPVITGFDTVIDRERDRLYADAVKFLKLIARNNPNLPAQSVSEINFDAREGIIIRLVDFPFPIYFGSGEVEKKYRQLREVLAVLYKDKKDTVDIGNVSYIRMEYYNNKVLVAQESSG